MRERRGDELTLAVACPDAVTARLVIELPPPALPLTRSLDLGEVPDELRIKLLAVAAVELIDAAVAARPPAPPPQPAGAAPAAPAPSGEPPLEPPARPTAPRDAALAAERHAPAPGAPDAIVPRMGVRVFPRKAVPLMHLGFDYERRWFSAGLSATVGSAEVELGSVSAFVVTITAGTRPLCTGRATRACVRARGELGLARARGRAFQPEIMERDVFAPYSQLGLELRAERAFGSISAMLAVEGGWAQGIVATAQTQTVLQLAGAVATAVVGLRWRP